MWLVPVLHTWVNDHEYFDIPKLGCFLRFYSFLQLYWNRGEKQLARQAFDYARSIDPSLALPWAGMSADLNIR